MMNALRKPDYEVTAVPTRQAPAIAKERRVAAFNAMPVPGPVALADSLYQLIVTSLEGPKGVQAESLLAAIGALAGYGARWVVRRKIEDGTLENDFYVPAGVRRSGIVVSTHVDKFVYDLKKDSFAAAFVPAILAAGSGWIPEINRTVQNNFMAINSPAYPDYTIPERHFPEVPPQALLLMLWEKTARCLRSADDGTDLAMASFGMAATRAVLANKSRVPMNIAGQLTLETAIAMSKVEYGF